MRTTTYWAVLLFIAVFLLSSIMPNQSKAQSRRSERQEGSKEAMLLSGYNVGYTVLKQAGPDERGGKTNLNIAVWYPSESSPGPFTYVFGENEVKTELAVDGKKAQGRFPLIIYAHGASASGISSAFIAETLARKGYVVAGVDFTDKFVQVRINRSVSMRKLEGLQMLKWMHEVRTRQEGSEANVYRKKLAYRPRQAQLTIDRLLAENKDPKSIFSGLIDDRQIGVVGHSFGAWTTMMLIGADPDYHDRRIKAAVALSGPVNEYVYSVNKPNDLQDIHVPIMFMYGEKEVKQGRGDDKKWLYDRANAPKYLLSIKDADHFAFSGGVRKEYPLMADYLRKNAARAAITEYTLAFFDYYLKADKSAKERLEEKSGEIGIFYKDLDASAPKR